MQSNTTNFAENIEQRAGLPRTTQKVTEQAPSLLRWIIETDTISYIASFHPGHK